MMKTIALSIALALAGTFTTSMIAANPLSSSNQAEKQWVGQPAPAF